MTILFQFLKKPTTSIRSLLRPINAYFQTMATNNQNEDITITITDEGYFTKTYQIKPTTNLKKLLDKYRENLCKTCTNPNTLEFWYEANKVS